MDKLYQQTLHDFLKLGHFYKNVDYSLDYEECRKNNLPFISVTIRRDWFIIRVDFSKCDFSLIKLATEDINKDNDFALGFIAGYKTAIRLGKSRIPHHLTVKSAGKKLIALPPIHKKYYKKIIKKILDYCFTPQYHALD